MASTLRTGLASGVICLALAACGGGGGDRAPGVGQGPNPPNGPVVPPPIAEGVDAADLTAADVVAATIVEVSMNSAPTVRFTLVASGGRTVTGVAGSALRAGLARLQEGEEYPTLSWTTDIRRAEDPVCRSQKDVDDSSNKCTTFTTELDPDAIPQTALKVQDPVATGKVARDQGTTESGGALVANQDGSYSYTLVTDPGDPEALATMHRICLQISLNAPTNNACVDFVPSDLVDPAIGEKATSLDDDFYASYDSRQLVADATCNSCHAQLAFHGGGRTATAYCTNCHNPVTADANSENELDLMVLVHRIHQSANLPSVIGGTPYKIWGNRNNVDDYSDVSYPQSTRQCTRCHAGQEDVDYAADNGLPPPEAVLTPDGHGWATYQGREACESCHDDKLSHGGGGSAPCIQCHNGDADPDKSIAARHRDRTEENARSLNFEVVSVTGTGADETPVVRYRLNRNGKPIDVREFDVDGDIKLGIGFDAASDYVNTGAAVLPVEVDAVANATPVPGLDNVFQVDIGAVTFPAGIDTLGITLMGFEYFCNENTKDCDKFKACLGEEGCDLSKWTSAITSLDHYAASSASSPTARRLVVDIDKCNDCHHRLAMTDPSHRDFHAAPTNNTQVCVMCHGPNLSFQADVGTNFPLLIHGLHASGFRTTPYKGFDTTRLQFPGDLADCAICHRDGTYELPLSQSLPPFKESVAGLYSSPVAATCASCHDDDKSQSHMESAGGAVFRVTQQEAADAIESCDVCHGAGKDAGVEAVHNK